MSKEVKELENSPEIKNMKRPCQINFLTYVGAFTMDVLRIVDIDLKQLKIILQKFRNIRKSLKGNDEFQNLLRYQLDSLIYIAENIIDMRNGENKFYIDCLKDLLSKKDNTENNK